MTEKGFPKLHSMWNLPIFTIQTLTQHYRFVRLTFDLKTKHTHYMISYREDLIEVEYEIYKFECVSSISIHRFRSKHS